MKSIYNKHLLLIILLTIISIFASFFYRGNAIYYLVFSFAAIGLLYYSISNFYSFSFLYLAIFLFMGFWVKMTFHLFFHYPFIEPTGNFKFTGSEWDKVLLVSAIGMVSAIFAYYIFNKFIKKRDFINSNLFNSYKVPNFYQKHVSLTWSICILFALFIIVLNIHFAILRSGLVPQIHFPLKIGAIITWFLYIGIMLILYNNLWWHICLKGNYKFHFVIIVIIATMISVTTLSRGLVIAQIVPLILWLFMERARLNIKIKDAVIIFIICMVAIFITASGTTILRNKSYHQDNYSSENIIISNDYDGNENGIKVIKNNNSYLWDVNKRINSDNLLVNFFDVISTINKLVIDRWIGLEGVMSVSSWPTLGASLFYGGWSERASYKRPSIYEKICKSQYSYIYNLKLSNRYYFSNVPGIIAMLYYSGSIVMTFAGMFILVLLILLSEEYMSMIISNPLIISFCAYYFAFIFVSFANAYLVILQIAETWMGILFIGFIHYLFISKGNSKAISTLKS